MPPPTQFWRLTLAHFSGITGHHPSWIFLNQYLRICSSLYLVFFLSFFPFSFLLQILDSYLLVLKWWIPIQNSFIRFFLLFCCNGSPPLLNLPYHHFLLLTQVALKSVLVSISPTFFARLFRTKVSLEAFLCLHFRFELFWRKNIGANVLIKCWWNWPLLNKQFEVQED